VLNHAYLSAKRIQSHGGYLAFGKLASPLYSGLTCPPQGRYADIAHLVNVQLIDQAGVKRFLKGGKKAGCFWWIGPTSETVCIAEGFATAASIYEATGNRCFIAFDAGNLPAVAKAVRKLYPHTPLIICADHDTHGIGQHYAEQAALEIGAAVAMPETPGADFNDVWRGCNG
jgi:putative DNA primase/helicase